MNEQRLKMMREGKVSTVLLKLGLPAMIGMITSALYNVVDAYFVGGLGTSQMGAVSIVFPLMMIIIGIGLTFGSGAGSYISRLLGEGDREQANKTASTAVLTSLIIGVVIVAGILFFLDNILIVLGATETILPFARAYAVIFILGGVFEIFNVSMNNIVISEGASRITMISMLLAVGLNIILDPIFIYTLGLGIKGAAIATVTAQVSASCFYLWYILGKKGILKISIKYFTANKTLYLRILKIGVPLLMLQLAASASMALINRAAQCYGDTAVAAMGIVVRISTLGAYVVFGYVKGFQPLAGYSYGAGDFKRLKQTINISLLWTTIYCGIVALIMIFLPKQIIGLFSKNNSELIAVGTAALRANGFIFITFGFQMVYSSLFLALGKAKEGGLLSMSRQGIFFIPFILILPRFLGLNGIIYTQLIADICTVILTAIFASSLNRELKLSTDFNQSRDEGFKTKPIKDVKNFNRATSLYE